MKDKMLKILNYFVKQINSDGLNTGLCKSIVKKTRDYINSTEIELSNRELDTLTEIRHNEPLRMLLIMSGIYINTIRDETIRFLYDNLEEIRQKNGKLSLTCVLFRLQTMMDYTYFHAEEVGIRKQVFTVTELKELQKEINNQWQKKNK